MKDYELEINLKIDQDSTAFVYQGSLYMISSAKRLYFIERKG